MTAKQKRIERRNKIKKIFNYDAEIKVLDALWQLKKSNMSLIEFNNMVTKNLVNQEIIGDMVLEIFIQDEHIRTQIEKKRKELQISIYTTDKLRGEILMLEDLLKEEEDDEGEFLNDDIFF